MHKQAEECTNDASTRQQIQVTTPLHASTVLDPHIHAQICREAEAVFANSKATKCNQTISAACHTVTTEEHLLSVCLLTGLHVVPTYLQAPTISCTLTYLHFVPDTHNCLGARMLSLSWLLAEGMMGVCKKLYLYTCMGSAIPFTTTAVSFATRVHKLYVEGKVHIQGIQ